MALRVAVALLLAAAVRAYVTSMLTGSTVFDGVWPPDAPGVAFAEVSAVAWGRVWRCDDAATSPNVDGNGSSLVVTSRNGVAFTTPTVNETLDAIADLEDYLGRAAVLYCTGGNVGPVWGVSWVDANVTSYNQDTGQTTAGVFVTCCVGPESDARIVVPPDTPSSPGVTDTLHGPFPVLRSGAATVCVQTDGGVKQCTPGPDEPDWGTAGVTLRHTYPGDATIATRCAATPPGTGGPTAGLAPCSCAYTQEENMPRFDLCTPCDDEADDEVLAFEPSSTRTFDAPLTCSDARTDHDQYCVTDWTNPTMRFDLPWYGWTPPGGGDPARSARWPPVQCSCYDPNRDPAPGTGKCLHCLPGWYEDTDATIVQSDTSRGSWRCLECAVAMDADAEVPDCAWDTGAWRPDDPLNPNPAAADCKATLTSAGMAGGYISAAAECVCKQGYAGAACDICAEGYVALDGVCAACPQTCGPHGTRHCSGDVDRLTLTPNTTWCECTPGFWTANDTLTGDACTACGHDVCGPGGSCNLDARGGIVPDEDDLCSCGAGWTHDTDDPVAQSPGFFKCSACDPTASLQVLFDAGGPPPPLQCLDPIVACSAVANPERLDVQASTTEGHCVCAQGFMYVSETSMNAVPLDANVDDEGVITTFVPGCLPVSTVCGVAGDATGVNETASTTTNTCVCRGQFTLAPAVDGLVPGVAELCTHITTLCGPGAVLTDGVTCSCGPRWAPIGDQPEVGRCVSCVDSLHTGPLCVKCGTACPGHAACLSDALPDGTPHVCACLSGWVDDDGDTPCSVCDTEGGWIADGDDACHQCPVCGPHGTCAVARHQAVCLCSDGWSHTNPQDPASPCSVCVATGTQLDDDTDCVACDPLCASRGVCQPGGVCECSGQTTGPPACLDCAPGTAGPGCPSCSQADCGDHGTCVWESSTLRHVCACDGGWTGSTCSDCPTTQHHVLTPNGTTCAACPDDCGDTRQCAWSSDDSEPVCACPPGWFGDDCSLCDPLEDDGRGCSACPCWQNTPIDPEWDVRGASCSRSLTTGFTCTCAPGWTHVVRGDPGSPCRPCGAGIETPGLCLTCPRCDPVSETCVETRAVDIDDTTPSLTQESITAVVNVSGTVGVMLATCVCKPGWTRFPGFLTDAHGCYPLEVVQGATALLADSIDTAATVLHNQDVTNTNHKTLTHVLQEGGGSTGLLVQFWMSVVVVGLASAAVGAAVVALGLRAAYGTRV